MKRTIRKPLPLRNPLFLRHNFLYDFCANFLHNGK